MPFKRNLSANGTCDFSEFFCDLICGGLSEPSGPSSVWFDSAASIGVIWRGSGMIETSRWRTSDLDCGSWRGELVRRLSEETWGGSEFAIVLLGYILYGYHDEIGGRIGGDVVMKKRRGDGGNWNRVFM